MIYLADAFIQSHLQLLQLQFRLSRTQSPSSNMRLKVLCRAVYGGYIDIAGPSHVATLTTMLQTAWTYVLIAYY